ncbi:hypothetical protein PP707_07215 [Acetobacter pasteurianus]|nr:hypothetical protein [Acetobacter pasteurianus]
MKKRVGVVWCVQREGRTTNVVIRVVNGVDGRIGQGEGEAEAE